MDLWQKEHGAKHIQPMQAKVWRIVEDQNKSATRKLVDTHQEHELLEAMIESSKPATILLKDYHYLLATPFRYPPLKHGSRFASRYEPSLWYGSRDINTALAEVAYYRLLFLNGSSAKFDQTQIRLTAFSAKIATLSGMYLTDRPFGKYRPEISSTTSYAISQPLGSAMRKANIQAFWYYSARDAENGVNIGIFTPQAFLSKKPIASSFQSWECICTKDAVEFTQHAALNKTQKIFAVEQFKIDGKIALAKY